MPDWAASMQQTFEYYIVNANTWQDVKKIDTVLSCTINRDSEVDTLGSATFDITEPIGECYIRVYLVTIQNGLKEKHALGTFLVQTPNYSFDGKTKKISVDAYTPLIELKEKSPPIGYSLEGYSLVRNSMKGIIIDACRAPLILRDVDRKENWNTKPFVASVDDTWLSFLRDFGATSDLELYLDERGCIGICESGKFLAPIWTYNDDNCSILFSDFDMEHDLFGVPNVVEVLYSASDKNFYSKVVNDDPDSPTSTINRGREIVHRVVNPECNRDDQEFVSFYAKNLLKKMSSLEYAITYKHGYCPVKLGDYVRFNYAKAGLNNVNAKVVSQTIECKPGCPVTEKAVFTTKLLE